jgi:DNA-binding transcriptional MerR regulator
MNDPEQLLTAIDAARMLGLSTDMVRTVRAANGYRLFRRADVERVTVERARQRAERTRKARA